MAVTKLLSITTRVDNRVRYIIKDGKTHHGELIFSYNCEADKAHIDFDCTATLARLSPLQRNARKRNILAYHLIQSFSPNDNVTPEEAHQIGKELADQLLGGWYEYVIATHTDTGKIHNHILFNSVSFIDYQKFRTQPYKTAQHIRSISDRLCVQHGLSVIPSPEKLGYSYAEWQARRSNTSWRSELRKRLKFALARSVSYDDFLDKCRQLDVAVGDQGKHIKFMLRDLPQERWSRGSKLADDDTFTHAGIKAQLEENAVLKAELTSALSALVPQCENFTELVQKTADQTGISIRTGKTGLLFSFPGGEQRRDSVLGAAFSKDGLEQSIQRKHFDPEGETADLRSQWEQGQHSINHSVGYIPIELPPDAVKKISLDGLLVRIPGSPQDDVVFLDNAHVDYNSITKRYTVWLAPPYQYYCVPEQPDPDVLESEQLGGIPYPGTELIRRMERAWGGAEQWVEVPPDFVHSASPKGLLLSVPGTGTRLIHIDPGDFELSNTSCKVRIFPHWTYAKDFFGAELIAALERQRRTPVIDLLWMRYRSFERRSNTAELERLSKALWTMEREDITAQTDFDRCAQRLESELKQNRERRAALETEHQNYTHALTALTVIADGQELRDRWAQSSGRERMDLEARYAVRLRMYERAVKQVERLGITLPADPDKITEYIAYTQKELKRLRQEYETNY